jgi:hypothetical protein
MLALAAILALALSTSPWVFGLHLPSRQATSSSVKFHNVVMMFLPQGNLTPKNLEIMASLGLMPLSFLVADV